MTHRLATIQRHRRRRRQTDGRNTVA